jgi:glycerophosphoryl diester phosphodiesterase/HEAT repeat protein
LKKLLAILCAALMARAAHAAVLQPEGVQLLCHRTANEDVPENTLDSLEEAALLGCNVVEIDLRRTYDGKIVLNHDGILERLTDGTGEIETKDYAELQMLDLGSWMSPRFSGMHIALFEDALRLAREHDIRLVLDIKDKGIGADVLRILERKNMLQRVQFGGEWEDIKKLYPAALSPGDATVWMQPGVTPSQVTVAHQQGKSVVVNFSANNHAMDLAGMKAAVAAGVDAINVDYPRLGADAVGRPVETTLHNLILKANTGQSPVRVAAILELSRYRGFPLQENFAHWLLDTDKHVSRAAAEVLITARPRTPVTVFQAALHSDAADTRANAAWALGELRAPVASLLPLLHDHDAQVVQAAMLATSRTPGEVSADTLLPFLTNDDSTIRGAAARALALHQPGVAIRAVPAQLRKEVRAERTIYDDRIKRGNPPFTQQEIDAVTKSFRCQMEMMRAIYTLPGDNATRELVVQALRPEKDFSEYNSIVAGFQLWDRVPSDPSSLVQALGSPNTEVAERAEWTLANGSPELLPQVRQALDSTSATVRERAMHILAWQADLPSLRKLQAIRDANGQSSAIAMWAIAKIENFRPSL